MLTLVSGFVVAGILLVAAALLAGPANRVAYRAALGQSSYRKAAMMDALVAILLMGGCTSVMLGIVLHTSQAK